MQTFFMIDINDCTLVASGNNSAQLLDEAELDTQVMVAYVEDIKVLLSAEQQQHLYENLVGKDELKLREGELPGVIFKLLTEGTSMAVKKTSSVKKATPIKGASTVKKAAPVKKTTTSVSKKATAPKKEAGYKGHRAGTKKAAAHEFFDTFTPTRPDFIKHCESLGLKPTTAGSWFHIFSKEG